MEITGEYLIPVPARKVWEGLNSPEILAACIPGCESLTRDEQGRFNAKVFAKVGPLSAPFKGVVSLENLNPPKSYDLLFEGTGGVAGFAKGTASISLTETDGGTTLTYTAQANVGGKLAQIGQRLIDSSARKMADDFFGNFCELAEREFKVAAPADNSVEQPAPEPLQAPPAITRGELGIWKVLMAAFLGGVVGGLVGSMIG